MLELKQITCDGKLTWARHINGQLVCLRCGRIVDEA